MFIFGPMGLLHNTAALSGTAATFDPASLFTGGKLGAWYDPSDPSSMFQDTAGTVPVTANNDPVGRINDKSGNGHHLLQATAGQRPLYQTGSGLSWLLFDGVDDGLASGPGETWAANSDYDVALRSTTDHSVLVWDTANSSNFIGAIDSVSGLTNNSGAGTLTNYSNGVAVSPDTRAGLYTALNGADKVYEAQGGAISFGGLSLGNYSGFVWGGRVYGIIVSSTANSASRGSVRTYLGAKAGLSL